MPAFYIGERASGFTTVGAGSTQAVTVSGNASAGSTIILLLATRDTSTAGCSIADTRSNTWTFDIGPLNGSNKFGFIASTRQDGGVLQNGDTVTVTFGTAPGPSRAWMLEEFGGLENAAYVDQTASNTAASTTSGDSGTTAATVQDAELAVACFSIDGGATATHDAAFADFAAAYAQDANGTNAAKLCAQYKILTLAGTQICNITGFPAATSYQGMIATYKTPGRSFTPHRMPLGV